MTASAGDSMTYTPVGNAARPVAMRCTMWTAKTRRFLLWEEGVTAVEYAILLALVGVLCLAAVTAGVQFNRFLKRLIDAGKPETNSIAEVEFATDSSVAIAPPVERRPER